MSSHEDSARLRAEQRLQEVAVILARGILRLQARDALAGQQTHQDGPEETAENSPGLP
jgi:hypothetical protein